MTTSADCRKEQEKGTTECKVTVCPDVLDDAGIIKTFSGFKNEFFDLAELCASTAVADFRIIY